MIQQIRASREQFRYNEDRTVKVELSSYSIMYHCRQVAELSNASGQILGSFLKKRVETF